MFDFCGGWLDGVGGFVGRDDGVADFATWWLKYATTDHVWSVEELVIAALAELDGDPYPVAPPSGPAPVPPASDDEGPAQHAAERFEGPLGQLKLFDVAEWAEVAAANDTKAEEEEGKEPPTLRFVRR